MGHQCHFDLLVGGVWAKGWRPQGNVRSWSSSISAAELAVAPEPAQLGSVVHSSI